MKTYSLLLLTEVMITAVAGGDWQTESGALRIEDVSAGASEIVLSDVRRSYAGQLSCAAHNDAGNAFNDFSVVVHCKLCILFFMSSPKTLHPWAQLPLTARGQDGPVSSNFCFFATRELASHVFAPLQLFEATAMKTVVKI